MLVTEHPCAKHFARAVYARLNAPVMRRSSTTDGDVPRMGADGAGLASTLAWMAGAQPDMVSATAADLARIVPGVRRILTYREPIGDRFAIEFEEGGGVPADLLSEGTVLALGLLTKCREKGRGRLMLLDDIDRGLDIGAQAKLVEVLRDWLKTDPELQIVCSVVAQHLKRSPMRASGFMQQLVRKVFELGCPCVAVEVLPDNDRLYRHVPVDRGNR